MRRRARVCPPRPRPGHPARSRNVSCSPCSLSERPCGSPCVPERHDADRLAGVPVVPHGWSLMCGIAGVVALEDHAELPEPASLVRMCSALRHRGPDEFGTYRDERAGLAHARLSIIDLSTGQQPLANETDSLWVVFNGEIFNYVELRGELEALGHRFRTRSDTEVIVHAWEAWGADAFRRFNGQWAIALWDRPARTLVLARDPFGVR